MRSGRNDLGGEQTRRPERKEMFAASKITPARSRDSRDEAGSRPTPFLGKADDTEEETGRCTPWDRRGMGPSIRGRIRRDNVGKLPWAAGAEYNLQRLFERGSRPKEERAQGEWHMTPYERGLWGNALRGDGSHISPIEVTPSWAKGLRALGGFSVRVGGRLDKTGATPMLAGRRGWGQTGKGGSVYGPAFKLLLRLGRPTEDSQGFKPDPICGLQKYVAASG
jgi:hypothetical protein